MTSGRVQIKLEYVLGALMILVSLYSIYLSIELEFGIVQILSDIVIIIVAAVIILDKKKGLMRTVGLVAIALGLNNIINAYEGLQQENDLVFSLELLSLLIGLMLISNGITFLRGTSKDSKRVIFATIFLFLQDLITSIYLIMEGLSVGDTLSILALNVPNMVLYVVFIIVLRSKGVKENTPLKKLVKDLADVRFYTSADPRTGILRDDLKIMDEAVRDDTGWEETDDALSEAEITLRVFYPKKRIGRIILQKRKKDDSIRLLILGDSAGSFMQGFRFKVLSISPNDGDVMTCRSVRIYGADGIFINLMVFDALEKRKKKIVRIASDRIVFERL